MAEEDEARLAVEAEARLAGRLRRALSRRTAGSFSGLLQRATVSRLAISFLKCFSFDFFSTYFSFDYLQRVKIYRSIQEFENSGEKCPQSDII